MKTKVAELMSSPVHTTSGDAGFRRIAETLQRHRIGALPVVDGAGHVIGVVSEADLLLKEEGEELRHGFPIRRLRRARAKAAGTDASSLMTAPAVTVRPETGAGEAARVMRENGIKHLVVIDGEDRPIGMVSRQDLLKVFLRGDDEIVRAVKDLVIATLVLDAPGLEVRASEGVVHLAGTLDRRSDVEILERLVASLDGVVGVESRLRYRWDDRRVRPEPSSPMAPSEWPGT
jgi:CBS domain-containing protein